MKAYRIAVWSIICKAGQKILISNFCGLKEVYKACKNNAEIQNNLTFKQKHSSKWWLLRICHSATLLQNLISSNKPSCLLLYAIKT